MIMWTNNAERDRPKMKIWRTRIAFWIPKAINTHSEYVILIACPRKPCRLCDNVDKQCRAGQAKDENMA